MSAAVHTHTPISIYSSAHTHTHLNIQQHTHTPSLYAAVHTHPFKYAATAAIKIKCSNIQQFTCAMGVHLCPQFHNFAISQLHNLCTATCTCAASSVARAPANAGRKSLKSLVSFLFNESSRTSVIVARAAPVASSAPCTCSAENAKTTQ